MKKTLRVLWLVVFFILPPSSFILIHGGCAAAGAAAYKVMGPPDVPAKYVPAKTPMLVLVENYRHQSSAHAHADTLSRQLADELVAHEVAPLVPLEKLQELRDAKPREFATMTVAQIAQDVGASQVLYVELRRADVTPLAGGTGYVGEAAAMVKVVDGVNGTTLWPVGQSDGYAVTAATKIGSTQYPTPADVRTVLYAQLTEQISRLFHKWKPDYEMQEKWSQP